MVFRIDHCRRSNTHAGEVLALAEPPPQRREDADRSKAAEIPSTSRSDRTASHGAARAGRPFPPKATINDHDSGEALSIDDQFAFSPCLNSMGAPSHGEMMARLPSNALDHDAKPRSWQIQQLLRVTFSRHGCIHATDVEGTRRRRRWVFREGEEA